MAFTRRSDGYFGALGYFELAALPALIDLLLLCKELHPTKSFGHRKVKVHAP